MYGLADYGVEILKYYKNYDNLVSKILSKRKTIFKNVSNQWRYEQIRNILKLTPRTPPLH